VGGPLAALAQLSLLRATMTAAAKSQQKKTPQHCEIGNWCHNSVIMPPAQPGNNSDIRHWMGNTMPARADAALQPPPNPIIAPQPPRRHRRIHDTDSSDDNQPLMRRRNTEAPLVGGRPTPSITNAQHGLPCRSHAGGLATGAAAEGNAVIVIDDDHDNTPATAPRIQNNTDADVAARTDDDDDGEIFVLPNTRASTVASNAAPRSGSRALRSRSRSSGITRRRVAAEASAETETSVSDTSEKSDENGWIEDRTPRRMRTSRRIRSCCEGEAEEDTADTDSASADESDDDAVDLYRSAIAGVRNRPNALQAVRFSTIKCPNCKLFAKFLKSFL
jgi:hypothetical protein